MTISPETELDERPETGPTIPPVLSLLPLRDAVIYPTLIAPLSVSRESSIALIEAAIQSSDRMIGVITQRRPDIDEPGLDDLYPTGCVAIIRTSAKMQEATRLIIQGISRFRVVELELSEPFLRARIEVMEEPPISEEEREEVEAMRRLLSGMFGQAVDLSPQMPEELRSLTETVNDPSVSTDLIAAHLTLPLHERQAVLDTIHVPARMRKLLESLARELRVLELGSKLHVEVAQEMSKSQRDYYLREQMKAIQRELGDFGDHDDEITELRAKIEQSGMPEDVFEEAIHEWRRLQRIHTSSPEYTVARTYLDSLVGLPWQTSTIDNLSLTSAAERLHREHYGLEKVKDRILDFLAVRSMLQGRAGRQPLLCLVGPPGVGKTSLGRTIAQAMGRKFVRLSLGGVRDESEIRGHRRTFVGSMPGQVIQQIKRAGSRNPVFVLDELDKLGRDFRGDPAAALLEVLDPEQNNAFRDHYLNVPFDLSEVFFIATANQLDTIPPALLDRMEVVTMGGYTEEEKVEIAKRHLWPKQREEHGLTAGRVAIADDAVRALIRGYTRESGVRNLERELAGVLRKAARQFAEGRKTKVSISAIKLEEMIGPARFTRQEWATETPRVGMAMGLAWTAVGGEVLSIETAKFEGTKSLVLTGQLGDVMKESVSAALTVLRSHAPELGIAVEAFEKAEIHVHLPAGAVPKDGPSAGVALLCAFASLFLGQPLRAHFALTGEITLTGQVLPVGGIKEKLLAAHRAGLRTVLVPKDNMKDVREDIPAEVLEQLTVHPVERAEEVLRHAFTK